MTPINFTHIFDIQLEEFLRITFNPTEEESKDLTELPNVKDREELERYEDEKIIRSKVRYFAVGSIPPAARKHVKPHMLSWIEHSTWDKAGLFWDWRIEPHFFKEYINCKGRMSLHDDGGRTKRRTRGSIEIRIPLFGHIAERAIVSHLGKNLDVEKKMWDDKHGKKGVIKS